MMPTGRNSLPPLDPALLPTDVRHASAKDRRTFESARGFERMLLGQLTKSMADTAKPAGDATDGSSPDQDAASAMYTQMLPDRLADAITSAGGIGLADNLYKSLRTTKR